MLIFQVIQPAHSEPPTPHPVIGWGDFPSHFLIDFWVHQSSFFVIFISFLNYLLVFLETIFVLCPSDRARRSGSWSRVGVTGSGQNRLPVHSIILMRSVLSWRRTRRLVEQDFWHFGSAPRRSSPKPPLPIPRDTGQIGPTLLPILFL